MRHYNVDNGTGLQSGRRLQQLFEIVVHRGKLARYARLSSGGFPSRNYECRFHVWLLLPARWGPLQTWQATKSPCRVAVTFAR